MKKTALFILTAAMILSAFAGCAKDGLQGTVTTPEPQENTAAGEAETPSPAATEDIIAEATADELRVMIEQYRTGGSYEMMYAAALRLIELEPSDTGAYTAAMDALIAMSSANYEQINALLAQGVENAEDAGALAGWAGNQPGLSIELPFIPDYESDEQINIVGTTSGNLFNDFCRKFEFWETGLFTSQGDWIYFSRADENFAIYKMRTDGSGYQRVGEIGGSCLNVVGDWIYFRNSMHDNQSEMYKMRTDGSECTKLLDGICDIISVSGDWIYYANGNDNFRVYRMRTDGSDNTALTTAQAMGMYVHGDWVYYTLTDESGFYRMHIDGSETQHLTERLVDTYCMEKDWIYYCIKNDGYTVWRMRQDGSGAEEVLRYDQPIATMNIAGDKMLLSVNDNGSGGAIVIVDMESFKILQTFEQITDAIYVDNGGNTYFADFNNKKWYRININTGKLNELPFEKPTLLNLGFSADHDNAVCLYEQRTEPYISIEVHRPEWGQKEYDFRFFTPVNGYGLIVTYDTELHRFHVSADNPDDGSYAVFDFDMSDYSRIDGEVSEGITVEEYFRNMYNDPGIEDVYLYSVMLAQQYIGDIFGMNIDELYALPVGE